MVLTSQPVEVIMLFVVTVHVSTIRTWTGVILKRPMKRAVLLRILLLQLQVPQKRVKVPQHQRRLLL